MAWVKSHTGSSGVPARVFFTTLGHPYDFKKESMRRLALNGVAWALGLEDRIPAGGFDVSPDVPYDPTNSGFGDRYRQGVRPFQIE